MAKPKDITNQRFGRLVAIQWSGNKDHTGSYLWLCQCDCGESRIISAPRLRYGNRNFCDCTQYSNPSQYRHGYASKDKKKRPSLYDIWCSMRQRCNDPNCKAYKYYGGRGIRVCERWDDFANFLADVGERPHPNLSLDRIDNDGDYEPDNVRWATREQQIANRRQPPSVPHGRDGRFVRKS